MTRAKESKLLRMEAKVCYFGSKAEKAEALYTWYQVVTSALGCTRRASIKTADEF